jgi:hypothetical protein
MLVLTRLCMLAIALASFSSRARAQVNPTPPPAGATFDKNDFLVRLMVKEGEDWIFPNEVEGKLYFNKARCECDTPVAIRIDMTATGVMKQNASDMDGTIRLYSGPANCVEKGSNSRPPNMAGCTLLATLPSLPELAKTHQQVETTVGKLFHSGTPPAGKGCSARFNQSVMMWIDADSNTDPDDGVAGAAAPALPIEYDGEPPAVPSKIEVKPGNEALTVTWSMPTVTSNLAGALVFCSRADLPVFVTPGEGGQPVNPFYSQKDYVSRQVLCPKKIVRSGVARIASAQTESGATPVYQPEAFGDLDPAYLCSNLLTTTNNWRIKILQNGIKYAVGVASVDTHGNASIIDTIYVQAPVLTKDFYRGYREAGGEASGCTYGSGALPGGLALAALATLALVRARRRR